MNKKVTAIIKTFERPMCLTHLLTSLRTRYPRIPVLIADDSLHPKQLRAVHTRVYPLPYDTGLAAGRNYLVDRVRTPYFLLLDDDFVFIDGTHLERMVELLDTTDLDIVGGRVLTRGTGAFNFAGLLQRNKTGMYSILRGQVHERHPDWLVCDVIPNFFMARTAAVKTVYWDPRLKLAEHIDFFIRALNKLKVGYCSSVSIEHERIRPSALYSQMRGRGTHFGRIYQAKYGWRPPLHPSVDAVRTKRTLPIAISRR